MSRLLSPFRKFRRGVWLLLLWSNRHLLGLWARSLSQELRHPVDPARTLRLVRGLLRVTSDSRLSNAPELRSLRVVDDAVIATADASWRHRSTVRTVLQGISRVNRVDFDDIPGTASVAAA